MTPVLFRKERTRDGVVTAVFPTIPGSPGLASCYAHVGQHSSCSRGWYNGTRPAKPEEYADLQAELVRVGYDDLEVRQRWTSDMDKQRRTEERA